LASELLNKVVELSPLAQACKELKSKR
jgi:hypothetical protein